MSKFEDFLNGLPPPLFIDNEPKAYSEIEQKAKKSIKGSLILLLILFLFLLIFIPLATWERVTICNQCRINECGNSLFLASRFGLGIVTPTLRIMLAALSLPVFVSSCYFMIISFGTIKRKLGRKAILISALTTILYAVFIVVCIII